MPSRIRTEQPDVRFRKLFVAIVVVLITVLFLQMIGPFLQAVFLAAVLTGMLYPLYTWLRKRLGGEAPAAGVTIVLVLIAVILPLLFVIGIFTREAVRLTDVIGVWLDQTSHGEALPQTQFPQWLPFAERLDPYRNQIYARVGDVIAQIGSMVADNLSRLTQSTVTFALNLFVMLYALFYFLLAGPRLLKIFDYTPLTDADRDAIVEKGISITRATLKGTVVIGIVQGLLGGVGFAVAGISAPALWGAVMALASVVPVVGTALIWVPAVAFLLFQGNVTAGMALLAWCAIIVSGVDNILRPKLVGNDTQMHGVLVLLSTLGGITMFGATGVIIGPVVAGLFLTNWHIFAAAFRRELAAPERAHEAAPALERELEPHDRHDAAA